MSSANIHSGKPDWWIRWVRQKNTAVQKARTELKILLGGGCSVCGCPYLQFVEIHHTPGSRTWSQNEHTPMECVELLRKDCESGLLVLVCCWCGRGSNFVSPLHAGRTWDQVVLACDSCHQKRFVRDMTTGKHSRSIVCCKGCLKGDCTCPPNEHLDVLWKWADLHIPPEVCRSCGYLLFHPQPIACESNHQMQLKWMRVHERLGGDLESSRCSRCGLFIQPHQDSCGFCDSEDADHVSELPSLSDSFDGLGEAPPATGDGDPGHGDLSEWADPL